MSTLPKEHPITKALEHIARLGAEAQKRLGEKKMQQLIKLQELQRRRK